MQKDRDRERQLSSASLLPKSQADARVKNSTQAARAGTELLDSSTCCLPVLAAMRSVANTGVVC